MISHVISQRADAALEFVKGDAPVAAVVEYGKELRELGLAHVDAEEVEEAEQRRRRDGVRRARCALVRRIIKSRWILSDFEFDFDPALRPGMGGAQNQRFRPDFLF